MMTQQRLRYLFEKYLRDELAPDEKKELMGNFGEIEDTTDLQEIFQQLWLDSGEPNIPVDAAGERRIQNVMDRIAPEKRTGVWSIKPYRWLNAAAVVLITLSVTLWFTQKTKKTEQAILVKNTHTEIKPGGNKAYLTTANGSTIVLNDIHTGNVVLQSGIQVSKVNNGLLVYRVKSTTPDINAAAQFNTITTPRGGQYQVMLADGTKVWLNSASSIKFPVAFNGNERNVEITGEVYFEVAKNKDSPFIVQANGVGVQVLGTHFNISAYPDDEAVITTLMEGSVRMSKGTAAVLLRPGQRGVAINNKQNITLQAADIEATEAWRKGQFIFHNQSIANVIKIMARWYDVDVTYEGNVSQKEFGGSASKDAGITTLLENMKLTGAIHYKIEGRRIIVMN